MRYWVCFLILSVLISGCSAGDKTVKKTDTIAKEDKYGGIGDGVAADGIIYSVSGVESYSEIGETAVSKKASGVFYLIYLDVENGREESYVFSPRVRLINNEKIYLPDLKAKFYLSNLMEWDKVINPGESHRGVIVFDVAEGGDLKLEIKDEWVEVDKIYISIPGTSIISKGVSEGVLKAREENKLLKAGIN